MATAQFLTASFATTSSYSVKLTGVQTSCADASPLVGEYQADYSELSAVELSATDPFMDELLANSRVVSSKRL